MDPLAFRQSSPPTRMGRRVVGDLILKAGLVGSKGEPVASVPKPAAQTSMPATHQMSLPLGASPTAPTPKPKTTGPQLAIPGTEPHQQHLPGTGEPSKIVSPSSPKPAAGGVVAPGPQARPGAKISPATAVGGASARTPAEHQAARGALIPPPSKPQPQYGKPMSQAAGPGQQTTLPGVAVHQQAKRGGAGTQLELPGGAAMHTPAGKEPAPRMETIGQAEARHRQTFGSLQPQYRGQEHQKERKELEASSESGPMRAIPKGAPAAKPPETEGMPEKEAQAARTEWERQPKPGQTLLPGMSTASRRAQQQTSQKLTQAYSRESRERDAAASDPNKPHQMGFGGIVEREQGPKTEAGKVGQTMRTGTPEERRAAIKQSAAGMRQRAEASGRQQPKEPQAAKKPEFKPSQAGADHHSNLSGYHRQMAEHHQHLMDQATKTGDHESANKHKMAAEAHHNASQLHGGQSKANAASEKASRLSGGKAPEGVDPAQYHQQMAQHHLQQHQATGDPRHQMAAAAHSQAAGLHSSAGTARSFGHSDTAEKLSDAAGVKGALTSRVAQTKGKAGSFFGHDQPTAGGGAGGGAGGVRTPVAGERAVPGARGSGTRGGRPMKGTAAYGVASPNIMGNFSSGYGLGLASGSLAGPMFQTAMLAQQGAGKLQSLASTRSRMHPRMMQQEQARDAQTAANQRQQQLQQMYQVANKSLIESTPPVRSGMRRIG